MRDPDREGANAARFSDTDKLLLSRCSSVISFAILRLISSNDAAKRPISSLLWRRSTSVPYSAFCHFDGREWLSAEAGGEIVRRTSKSTKDSARARDMLKKRDTAARPRNSSRSETPTMRSVSERRQTHDRDRRNTERDLVREREQPKLIRAVLEREQLELRIALRR